MYFLIEEYLTPQAFTGEATVEEDDKDPEPAASEEEEGVVMTGGSVNLYMYAVNFP